MQTLPLTIEPKWSVQFVMNLSKIQLDPYQMILMILLLPWLTENQQEVAGSLL